MDFIKTYPNTLTEKYCLEIIDHYKEYWENVSRSTASNLNSTVKELTVSFTDDPYWENVTNELKVIAQKNIEEYLSFNPELKASENNLEHLTLMHHKEQFNIPIHYDSEVGLVGDTEVIRRFAILVYLNGDFDGGELMFPVQKKVIKPEPGLMTIFPTSFMYPHLTTPTFGNDRYVLRLGYFMRSEVFVEVSDV